MVVASWSPTSWCRVARVRYRSLVSRGSIETHGSQNPPKPTKNPPKHPQNPPKTPPQPPHGGFGEVFGVVWGGFWGVLEPVGFNAAGHGFRGPALGRFEHTLCYAIVLPGRKSGFRAGFRPDSIRESIEISPSAGRRPAGGLILMLSRLESGRNPARKPDFRPGSTIA